jgi:TPR repeat protein
VAPPQVARAPEPPARPVTVPPDVAKAMLEKGRAAEAQGDISGARRYYMIAAQGGLGPAALALGRLYDPQTLRGKTVGGIDPDPAQAKHWYDLADKLGIPGDPSNHQNVSVK